jgi:hypothetical protein
VVVVTTDTVLVPLAAWLPDEQAAPATTRPATAMLLRERRTSDLLWTENQNNNGSHSAAQLHAANGRQP